MEGSMLGSKLANQGEDRSDRIALIMASDQRGLQPVFGIPAVRRLALLLGQLGFSNIHVIGHVHPYRPALSDLVPFARFHPLEAAGGIARVLKQITIPDRADILALKASHVLDKPTLSRLLDGRDFPETVFLEIERNRDRIYLTSPRRASAVLNELWNPVSNPGLPGPARHIRVRDGLPCVLDGSEGLKQEAEAALLSSMAFQTSASDGFFARHISRRISRVISRRLVLSGITPNQVTVLGAMVGLAGAACFAQGGYWSGLAGSVLFLLCVIVDGVDGEIARLKLLESNFGHKLDIILDNVVHAGVFAGIGTGLYRGSGDPEYLVFLLILLVGFGLCGFTVYHFSSREGEGYQRSPKLQRIIDLLNNRDFAYLLLVFSATASLNVFLAGAAVGTFAFALTVWVSGSPQIQALGHSVKESFARLLGMVFDR